ncbi:MAG: hypothetical protein ACLPIC_09320 [Rhodoblastus sp.]|uniref:hypothetical protein n=1 Tax=Rhodoblastus sp. TaxID=1962975 RepID=UPI003F94439D
MVRVKRLNNRSDPLIKLIAANLFGGAVLGAILATVLLVFDMADLRTLALSGDTALTAIVMLFVCSASTFATAAIAGAIMMLAVSDNDEISGNAPMELGCGADRH